MDKIKIKDDVKISNRNGINYLLDNNNRRLQFMGKVLRIFRNVVQQRVPGYASLRPNWFPVVANFGYSRYVRRNGFKSK